MKNEFMRDPRRRPPPILAATMILLGVVSFFSPALAAEPTAGEGGKLVFVVDTGVRPTYFSYRWSYRTVSDSATAGVDFEPVSGKLEFEPGESKKSVPVQTLKDCYAEGDEFVILKLYDLQVKGLHRGVDGWVEMDFELRGFPPKEWRIRGKIVDVYNPQEILGHGCN